MTDLDLAGLQQLLEDARHEVGEDRRLAGIMRKSNNRELLIRRAEITEALVTLVETLSAAVGEYEGAISWGTSCLACSKVLDASIRDHERAEAAEAEPVRVTTERDQLREELNRVHRLSGVALARPMPLRVKQELREARDELVRLRAERDQARSENEHNDWACRGNQDLLRKEREESVRLRGVIIDLTERIEMCEDLSDGFCAKMPLAAGERSLARKMRAILAAGVPVQSEVKRDVCQHCGESIRHDGVMWVHDSNDANVCVGMFYGHSAPYQIATPSAAVLPKETK
jgi:hypothetical protein